MKRNKIVVLSNVDSSTQNTLKSAVSFAKMINGEIEVFNVTQPLDIIAGDNQLSAVRTLNNQHTAMGNKMKNLILQISKEFDVDIKFTAAFGNIKNEIKNFIEERQPDLIVISKRKSNPFKLIGNGITQFVFNTFKGAVLIASNKNVLEPNKDISLGLLNNNEEFTNLKFADNLLTHSKSSLTSFKIANSKNETEKTPQVGNKKVVEYVFEHNDGSIKNLSNYVAKNRIDFLYLNKSKRQTNDPLFSNIKSLTSQLDVTLLVT